MDKSKSLNRSKVPGLLAALSHLNLIYRVTFTKADGTERNLVCRGGVGKYVKGNGKGKGAAQNHNSMFNVYQMNGKNVGSKNYRSVNMETVTSIKTCGIEADVTPAPMIHIDISSNQSDNVVPFKKIA